MPEKTSVAFFNSDITPLARFFETTQISQENMNPYLAENWATQYGITINKTFWQRVKEFFQ